MPNLEELPSASASLPPDEGRVSTPAPEWRRAEDPLLAEFKGMRGELREHNAAAQRRHNDLMKSLNGQSKSIDEIAAGRGKAWADIKRAGLWIGPKVWEMLRVPAGGLLTGALLLMLSRLLGVSPAELLNALGSTPIPVQVAPGGAP